ncbi:MAG TPA: UbiD family decarboxylase [Geobacteraceae bacterium]
MAYRDLQAFLARLEEEGELRRIGVEVDPILELAAVTDRVCKVPGGGEALLFERVKGSPFPVATNLFGSSRRLCLALEVSDLDALSRRMEEALVSLPPRRKSPRSGWPEFAGFAPRIVTSGLCQEVVDEHPDLALYPFLKNWPGDGAPASEGRFITLPLVVSRDPETGAANCGMYRVELYDGTSAGIHWRSASGGATHSRAHCRRGERMPVAVAIGADPTIIHAATMPLPETVDEMAFAGFLRGAPVELVRCVTNDLLVPAHAELVLEGFIEPGDERQGGDFGNHTGYYSPGGRVPVLRVSAVTRRRACICPATVVGPPPMEDCWLARATERLLLPLLRRELPEIVDINLPFEGIFHGCAVVAMAKRGPAHPRRVMERLWSGGWLRDARLLVMVDQDVDVRDLARVAWKVINNVTWSRDLVLPSLAADGGKLGIDGTRKRSRRGGEDVVMSGDITRMVDTRWREYGF